MLKPFFTNAGKIIIFVFLTRVMYVRYEFQGLKTFDRILLGISFSVNVSPTKIRIWHGILYYAPGRKWCCETELGEVSRCESLVTLHHQSYLRTITSNVIIQNIFTPKMQTFPIYVCIHIFIFVWGCFVHMCFLKC